MPSLRGVTVHVTDHKGKELAEWGVQRLRQSTGKGEKVSAYIQSTTGVQFQVSVQPRIPFVHVDHPGSESEVDQVDHIRDEQGDWDLRNFEIPRHPGESSSKDGSTNRHQHTERSKDNLALSPPVHRHKNYSKVPEYVFIASLFLDGRKTPERKVIIYLDPANKDFARPHGKVSFKHRWVQSRDGTMTEHAWVFKEKGIESSFDRLMIATSQARDDGHDEDAIIEAMQSSGLGSENGFGAEKSKVGQIVVEVSRVILGEKKYDKHYRSKHQEGQDDDVDMAEVKPDVTHATGFACRSTIAPSPLRVVDFWDYKPGEGIWATFQFFYRSAEQLQNFGFPGFQNKSNPAKMPLNTRMAGLTPLSIAQPLTRVQNQSKQDIESFEEKINKKNFKPKDDKPELDFGSEYRDASADDEMETEESYKYPATPLPFFVPKAPRVGPRRDITIPGLPTLDRPAVSRVASTLTAAKTLVDLKQPTGTSRSEGSKLLPPFSATGSASSDRPNLEARSGPPSYPGLGDASTSNSAEQLSLAIPTSLRTYQGSSPPSRTSLSKENVDKLGGVSSKGFRVPPPAQAQNSDADDEGADDELNTESDLETHADDEAFGYSANPEEDDEGHHVLRSQFNNVALKKRAHADVGHAEEQIEGISKVGNAKKHVGDDGDSSRVQETSVIPPTEEERAAGRNGKKARTVSSRKPEDLLFPLLPSPAGVTYRIIGEGNGA